MGSNDLLSHRKRFGDHHDLFDRDVSDCLGVQVESYNDFLAYDKRDCIFNIRNCFDAVFPVVINSGEAVLEFVDYEVGKPSCGIRDAIRWDTSCTVSIEATMRLVLFDTTSPVAQSHKKVLLVKEQKVLLCRLPYMIDGSFVVNGVERVIVSQVQRSPGLFCYSDVSRVSSECLKYLRIIPTKGMWVDLVYSEGRPLYCRIDRRRKLPITLLLSAIGMSRQDVYKNFYTEYTYVRSGEMWNVDIARSDLIRGAISHDVMVRNNSAITLSSGIKPSEALLNRLFGNDDVCHCCVRNEDLLNLILSKDVTLKDASNGVLYRAGTCIDSDVLEAMLEADIDSLSCLNANYVSSPSAGLLRTMQEFPLMDKKDASKEIYNVLRSEYTLASGDILESMFFTKDTTRYNLGPVGRVKINERLKHYIRDEDEGWDSDDVARMGLNPMDFILSVRMFLMQLDSCGDSFGDDIDHLSNRRLRTPGELIYGAFLSGLNAVAKNAKDKMSSSIGLDVTTVSGILHTSALQSSMDGFFAASSSQGLVQLKDAINPLSSCSHKRRCSALGSNGLVKERATFEVRDVHYTHYGRFCPIETPEGPNIGLIMTMSLYSKVDKHGFLLSPYRKVIDGVIQNEVRYLSASEECGLNMATAKVKLDAHLKIQDEKVLCRNNDDMVYVEPQEVHYIDVSHQQTIGLSTSLIPFLECNDANRALMGANMQRQAVPLLKPQAPFVGTGMESVVARHSGAIVTAQKSGIVRAVDSSSIVIDYDESEQIGLDVGIYDLQKFSRSNSNTYVNYRPNVSVGDKVQEGCVIASGSATDKGELALGRNLRVGFVSFYGLNNEDSIVISEDAADYFQSMVISEYECVEIKSQSGDDKIVADNPCVRGSTNHLDGFGVVRVGSVVRSGDVLVSKVTPRLEYNYKTAEERLLYAIFGDGNMGEVKDSSLYAPPGIDQAVVIDVSVMVSRNFADDKCALMAQEAQLNKVEIDVERRIKILEEFVIRQISTYAENDAIDGSGAKVRASSIQKMSYLETKSLRFESDIISQKVSHLYMEFEKAKIDLLEKMRGKVQVIQSGHSLPSSTNKKIVVTLASMRCMRVGDKMSGRHGNKGVVSAILPKHEMPYSVDEITGMRVSLDIVLNPLGVPSRMNIGQIFEVHLGLVAKTLGERISQYIDGAKIQALRDLLIEIDILNDKSKNDICEITAMSDDEIVKFASNFRDAVRFAVPAFAAPSVDKISQLLKLCSLPESGQLELFDGRTGRKFDRAVTVGYIYMLKLNHLVDDKIHARSTGSYSLVTQQPLGGKAYRGGQRLGEMEFWALEAYGAAYCLHEMLTIKSDDIEGRSRLYQNKMLSASGVATSGVMYGVPESIKVLKMELAALGLNLDVREPEYFGSRSMTSRSSNDLRSFPLRCSSVKISVASADDIRAQSYGEIKNSETVNYRTLAPEMHGLFCANIFGPIRDHECSCGKYRKIKYRGLVCEKCGTEVTYSRVRRERMGHIELHSPVVHPMYHGHLAAVLNFSSKDMMRIIYRRSYVVLEPGDTEYEYKDMLPESKFEEVMRENAADPRFKIDTGSEAVDAMIANVDLEVECRILRLQVSKCKSEIKRRKMIKHLRIMNGIRNSGNKLSSFILKALPVMPPGYRPMISVKGKIVSSDHNLRYRMIMNRNIRAKKLKSLNAPRAILNSEYNLVQDAVDGFYGVSRRKSSSVMSQDMQAKSLADALRGKDGRFRQNLLGKRVDYSARSVIVAGPHLKLNQCGLPRAIALELYKPMVCGGLIAYGYASTNSEASNMIQDEHYEVFEVLADVVEGYPVLLNRAPTLHKLGIQAFDPVLTHDKAIKLHPLVCTAYNADFDGDQMAVHLPVTNESKIEARMLMKSTENILSPANGEPIMIPHKDMTLGLHYMTYTDVNDVPRKSFDSIEQVDVAMFREEISLHDTISVPVYVRNHDNSISQDTKLTTVGRYILYSIISRNAEGEITIDMVDKPMKQSEISTLVSRLYDIIGPKKLVDVLDGLKDAGFLYSTLSGISFGKADMMQPETKVQHIASAMERINTIEGHYRAGLIADQERKSSMIDVWTECTNSISDDVMHKMSTPIGVSELGKPVFSSMYHIVNSGARGSAAQVRQLVGMRGLMARTSGDIIETPITDSFVAGLHPIPFFISAHGARKGLSDVALKTSDSGYFTRRLSDCAQQCVVVSMDCGVTHGAVIDLNEAENVYSNSSYSIGRFPVDDICDADGSILVSKNDLITRDTFDRIVEAGVTKFRVRSVISCQEEHAKVCVKCYGSDLSKRNRPISIGSAVGIIAAQSIGEPGTQLTMRTFHIGGIAKHELESSSIIAQSEGVIQFDEENTAVNSSGDRIVMRREVAISIVGDTNTHDHMVNLGATLHVKSGERVNAGYEIATWDNYGKSIIAGAVGVIRFSNITEGISCKIVRRASSGTTNRVIARMVQGGSSSRSSFNPAIEIIDNDGNVLRTKRGSLARYVLPEGAIVGVQDGDKICAGDSLARIPITDSSRSGDITGGLPRVIDLFEVRQPKSPALIAKNSGIVAFGGSTGVVKRKLEIYSEEGGTLLESHNIPTDKHPLVLSGESIERGDLIIDGQVNPHDILEVHGVEMFAKYLLNRIQEVYVMQGVRTDDKHIEVVLRQMLQVVRVIDPGDSETLKGEELGVHMVEGVNEKLIANGERPIEYVRVVQGITRASLNAASFISAASFQETARVIAEAAAYGREDYLHGLKENIIMGNLIPAGTGVAARHVYSKAIAAKTVVDSDEDRIMSNVNIKDSTTSMEIDEEMRITRSLLEGSAS